MQSQLLLLKYQHITVFSLAIFHAKKLCFLYAILSYLLSFLDAKELKKQPN